MSPGRLEAFSDGVFAIAITLLVLNLAVPHAASGHLLAEYAGTADAVVATALYGIWAGFGAAVFVALWLYLRRHPHLVRPQRRDLVGPALRRSSVGPVAFGVASLVALVAPWVATALYGLIMVCFAIGWVPTWPSRRRGTMGAWTGRH